LRQAWHGVGIVFRTVLFEIPDFSLESFAEGFIGVEGEDPVVSGLFGSPVLLTRQGLSIRRAPSFSASSVVRSTEPESSTRISSQQRRLSIARAMWRSSFSVMIVAVIFMAPD